MNQIEIAKELNVSQGLISQILNNPDISGIPEKKKKQILDFIKKIGYEKKKKKTNIHRIGYITCLHLDTYNDLYMPYFLGVGEAARAFELELATKNYKPNEIKNIKSIESVEGYIAQSPFFNKNISFLNNKNTVFLDNSLEGFDCIVPDNYKTAYIAVEYFVRMGHTNIALWLLQKPSGDIKRISHYEEVLSGFQTALRHFGLEPSLKNIYLPEAKECTVSEIDKYAADFLRQWKSTKNSPSAIFTGDVYALRMMEVAGRLGLSIPNDISIIGFDNIRAGEFSVPPLTTVEHNREEMGRLSIELLLSRLKRPSASSRKLICEPFLVERKSVANMQRKIQK